MSDYEDHRFGGFSQFLALCQTKSLEGEVDDAKNEGAEDEPDEDAGDIFFIYARELRIGVVAREKFFRFHAWMGVAVALPELPESARATFKKWVVVSRCFPGGRFYGARRTAVGASGLRIFLADFRAKKNK